VSGQLTWRTSRGLHSSFRRVVDEGGRELRVDLRSVSEVDPAGVAVLLVFARLLPSLGGTLEVSDASAPCQALLQRMQLSHLLDQPRDAPAAAIHLHSPVGSDLTVSVRAHPDRRRARPTAAFEGAS
jgi:ABC-type transporter Mla MlaB component